tara:strand:+ start:507 stop:710 length:204 start_codon:yes stop_codon:yes gene_type:complete
MILVVREKPESDRSKKKTFYLEETEGDQGMKIDSNKKLVSRRSSWIPHETTGRSVEMKVTVNPRDLA